MKWLILGTYLAGLLVAWLPIARELLGDDGWRHLRNDGDLAEFAFVVVCLTLAWPFGLAFWLGERTLVGIGRALARRLPEDGA